MTNTQSNGIELLLTDARGIYIPRDFVQSFNMDQWSVSPDDIEILSNPDHEWYLDTWCDITDSAKYTDTKGNVWTLYQDGDLWAVCPELMDNETYQGFFGEMKPAPADAYEYAVCSDCLIALANDDYTGMDDAQEKATRNGLAVLHQQYGQVIPDGAEYGFQSYACECCDGLAGDRCRVLCFDKKGN